MLLITDLSKIATPFRNTVLTIGNFDGIHVGHQALIRMVIRRAQENGALSLVVTFRPHPLKILAPEKCPPLISIYEEKVRLIERLGVDVLVKIPFTVEFAGMSPRDFVRDVLCGLLGAREIIIGDNYRFGKNRGGNVRLLRELGGEYGFSVQEIQQVSLDGDAVSSTKIRHLLRDGMVEQAAVLLGRLYALSGIVIRGDGRGRTIGFPTANIAPKHAIIPANGVYAVRVYVRERSYDGIANIGVRPTFNKQTLSIEVYIFSFDEDLYGEEITVFFLRKIRDEKRFENVEALVAQIRQDIVAAEAVIGTYPAVVENPASLP